MQGSFFPSETLSACSGVLESKEKKKQKKNSVHLRLLQLGYKMDDEAN